MRDVVLRPKAPIVDNDYLRMAYELEEIVKATEGSLGKDPFPLKHSFAEGVYIRELHIPKGYLCIGALHKDSYTNIIQSGDMSVVTEDGFKRVSGPSYNIAPAMTKRFGYAHADTVWLTVHPNPTNSEDIDWLEEQLHIDNYELPEPVDGKYDANHVFGEFIDYAVEIDEAFNMEHFRELTKSLHTNEKVGFWSDWTQEQRDAYMSGDWEEFSKVRGYSDLDIDELREWIEMYEAAVKFGINPAEHVMDILIRSSGKNILLDTKGEIMKSSHMPTSEKLEYKEVA
jgi:hypothetical protein